MRGEIGAIGGVGAIRAIGRVTTCRDARAVRPSPLKPTAAVTFDTTDAQIVRPYKGYSSRASQQGATRLALTRRTPSDSTLLCVPTRVTRPVRSYTSYTSPEEIGKRQGENELSPRNREVKLRKNEMKLRKKQIEVPKNCVVPQWRIRKPS